MHEIYAKEMRKFKRLDYKSAPYFSPSSAGKDMRELYVKALRMPKDADDVKPWQRRYTARGTAIGDWLQREVLLAERHFEKFTGKTVPFKMARRDDGAPFFEDFVHGQRFFEHNGQRFSILGTNDGVLECVDENGEIKRIGLEIKSKQTSYSETGFQRMKGPKDDHVKQVTCYGLMYDLDAYLIIYVNCSVKAWFMTDDEFAKAPDFRVFGVEITEDMKTEILDKFAEVTRCVAVETPPALDLDQFRFNNFKRSCALSLSDEEFEILKAQVRRAQRSGLPQWKKEQYYEAFEFIREVREKEAV
ncbi:hypothetical protein [Robertmurraya andreesenii]|uniref:YqaJ-like viral recombinase domain protein n=1 Tax=Anoxybacillus andreesenii TaxID=1325932 RepID=A0ABT9V1X9_9BACL|nr:hypothetical protein [Robertmurraya andreesenii]MDQ0154955.1 hypothetical protein [Robertmurraya andreesenii]